MSPIRPGGLEGNRLRSRGSRVLNPDRTASHGPLRHDSAPRTLAPRILVLRILVLRILVLRILVLRILVLRILVLRNLDL